jgi:hypothetical protein
MAERRRPLGKKPDEILESVFVGHREALLGGSENGKRYLLNFLEKFNSIPNAVKFFVYDLLAEDAYQVDDIALCREAVDRAAEYLEDAQVENSRQFAEYLSKISFLERGVSVMVEEGEFEKALSFCDLAIKIGLDKVWTAKKASIERML